MRDFSIWEHKEPNFIAYFRDHYANRTGMHLHLYMYCHLLSCGWYSITEKWAKCFRMFEHADTDTNMFLERLAKFPKFSIEIAPFKTFCMFSDCSFHNKLKMNPAYFDGKINRRVDYLVQTLLKFEEDMFLTRQQKLLGMKRSRKAAMEGRRHQHGLQLLPTSLTVSGTNCKSTYCV